MTPAGAIASLDRQIAKHGQTITLRRPGTPNIDVTVQAFVRGFQPAELVGGIEQGDAQVILSPTSLGLWPLPVTIGDKVLIAGAPKDVQAPEHVRMLDTIVRINLQVRG